MGYANLKIPSPRGPLECSQDILCEVTDRFNLNRRRSSLFSEIQPKRPLKLQAINAPLFDIRLTKRKEQSHPEIETPSKWHLLKSNRISDLKVISPLQHFENRVMALVLWDLRGQMFCCIDTTSGPIRPVNFLPIGPLVTRLQPKQTNMQKSHCLNYRNLKELFPLTYALGSAPIFCTSVSHG